MHKNNVWVNPNLTKAQSSGASIESPRKQSGSDQVSHDKHSSANSAVGSASVSESSPGHSEAMDLDDDVSNPDRSFMKNNAPDAEEQQGSGKQSSRDMDRPLGE